MPRKIASQWIPQWGIRNPISQTSSISWKAVRSLMRSSIREASTWRLRGKALRSRSSFRSNLSLQFHRIWDPRPALVAKAFREPKTVKRRIGKSHLSNNPTLPWWTVNSISTIRVAWEMPCQRRKKERRMTISTTSRSYVTNLWRKLELVSRSLCKSLRMHTSSIRSRRIWRGWTSTNLWGSGKLDQQPSRKLKLLITTNLLKRGEGRHQRSRWVRQASLT